jgi:hypothetical protein
MQFKNDYYYQRMSLWLALLFLIAACRNDSEIGMQAPRHALKQDYVKLQLDAGEHGDSITVVDSMLVRIEGCESGLRYNRIIADSDTLMLYKGDANCIVFIDQFTYDGHVYTVKPGSVFNPQVGQTTPFVNGTGGVLYVKVLAQPSSELEIRFEIREIKTGNDRVLEIPKVSLAVSHESTIEGDTEDVEFVFTRDSYTANDLKVGYDLLGTATGGSDMTDVFTGNVIIPAGSASVSLTTKIVDDAVAEQPESIVLRLQQGKNYIPVGPEQGVMIEDDDAVPPAERVVWLTPSGFNVSGGLVTSWSDQSGRDHSASQGSSQRRPTYIADGINSLAAAQFDGSNDLLTIDNHTDINTATSYTEKTMVAVVKTGADVTSRQVIWEQGAGSRGLNIYLDQGQAYFHAWQNNGAAWGHKYVSVEVAAHTVYYLKMVFDSNEGTIKGYLNGAIAGAVDGVGPLSSHSAIGVGGINNRAIFHDGAEGTTASFRGQIAEIMVYNDSMTEADQLGIDAYISEKYAISISNAVMIESSQTALFEDSGEKFDVTVRRLFASANPLEVEYVISGSATEGIDYGFLDGVVTIPAYQTSVTFPVWLIDDSLQEGSETISLTLKPVPSHEIAVATVGLEIQDDESYYPPTENFVLWLNAETGVTTSGSSVLGWVDQSGRGHQTAPSETSARPTRSATSMGGRAGITFGGDDDLVLPDHADLGAATYYDAKTVAIAFKTGATVTTGQQVVWEQGAANRGLSAYIEAGKFNFAGWNRNSPTGGVEWNYVSVDADVLANTLYYVVLEFDAIAGELRGTINGSSMGSVGGVYRLDGSNNDSALGAVAGTTRLKNKSVSTAYFKGTIGEMFQFNRILSIAEMEELKEYLQDKYW